MNVTVAELAELLGGRISGAQPAALLTGFATDSREAGPGIAFLAIKGARVDGHDFATEVISAGSPVMVVEREVNAPYILVSNLISALAKAGNTLRKQFDGPVVGVTGSNGKTTTKEFVAAALSTLGPVLKNEGNRNTEYTSPLVWFDRQTEHRSAVIEMGMRGFGQIDHLARIAEPTIGIITNIGTAHMEMVESRAGIAKAKSELIELLPANGYAILPRDDEYFDDLRNRAAGQVVTFGFLQEADAQILGYRPEPTGASIQLRWQGQSYGMQLPMVGRHQALNAAAAFAAAVCAGGDPGAVAAAIANSEPPPMRMEIKAWRGLSVIFDAYNSSPDSTRAAIQTLLELPASGERVAVLGEMKELGEYTESGHRAVGSMIAEGGIDRVILIGPDMEYAKEAAIAGGYPSERITSFEYLQYDQIQAKILNSSPESVVLIKGSRSLALENLLRDEAGSKA